MKKVFFVLLISTCFNSCTKNCGECFIVEFEADGVTLKQETLMGEYCGSDAKVQAGDDANVQGITCNNCRIECR
jgi:hypothetical protein